MNQRPSGYEPDELPDCSTPRRSQEGSPAGALAASRPASEYLIMQSMPSDFALKTMNAVHRALLSVTLGKVGWRASGMPVLELTTIGRKSGEPRSCLLTSPLQIGDTYLIVASRGGDDRNPAWFLNLQANPEVQVRIGG